jgi:hypothetical protein
MRHRSPIASLSAGLALVALGCGDRDATTSGEGGTAPPLDDPAALAEQAFVWGYPLVVSQRTMQSIGALVGVNALLNQAKLTNASTRIIVSPNQDTLYSVAVLDLRAEPMVLEVPDVLDRYWTYQLLDAWTSSFHYLGTRATSGLGGRFAITAPGWEGALPDGVERIESPTSQAFLLGRFLVDGPDDVANVAAIDRTLTPLSVLAGSPAPEPPPPLGAAPGRPVDTGLDGAAFFDELSAALAVNAPAREADARALASFAPLGIGPGSSPSQGPYADALAEGAALALATLEADGLARAKVENGWVRYPEIGADSSDPLLRAVIARIAWGANVPEESIYALSDGDASGTLYDGGTPRVLRFEAGALPPVDPTHGFWSVTLYGPDRFFVENELDRYAIGDRTPGLVYGDDGSLELVIASEPPAEGVSNWLPAPAGPYSLMLRAYLPDVSAVASGIPMPEVVVR